MLLDILECKCMNSHDVAAYTKMVECKCITGLDFAAYTKWWNNRTKNV